MTLLLIRYNHFDKTVQPHDFREETFFTKS